MRNNLTKLSLAMATLLFLGVSPLSAYAKNDFMQHVFINNTKAPILINFNAGPAGCVSADKSQAVLPGKSTNYIVEIGSSVDCRKQDRSFTFQLIDGLTDKQGAILEGKEVDMTFGPNSCQTIPMEQTGFSLPKGEKKGCDQVFEIPINPKN